MARSDPHVLILGSFFTGNLGDHAILAAERRLVAEICDRQVTPFPFKPGRYPGNLTNWTVRKLIWQLYHVPFHYLRLFLRARAAETVVIGGGNLLQDHSTITPFLTLLTCLVIRAAGVRFSFLAVGTGPFTSRLSRRLYRYSLNLAERVSVRDPISYDLIAELVSKPKLELVCDPALTLPSSPRAPVKKRWKVGLVILPHRRPQYDFEPDVQEFEAYLQRVGHLVHSMIDKYGEGSVLLFTSELPDDQAAIEELLGSGLVRRDQVSIHTPTTLEELLTVVREVEVIISTRLHPILLGISQGTPGVGIDISSKMPGFFTSVDLPEYCIGLDSSPDRFVAVTDDLIQHPERFMTRFAAGSERHMRGLKATISNVCAVDESSRGAPTVALL